ncbi:MAG: RNA methyltransferase [Clostridiales bacterium]|mgnify:FL=1|uniref:TrmH family RNA methyltransferase n=1 Tax=Zhenhengia sp. TaxID=2944208 RepID=UPI00290E3096|nr:RNA methyltransferase [Clostridiales bacterium]
MANSKFITSAANPIIKNIQLLQSKKNERKKQGLFIIEGIRSINEIPQEYEIDTIVMSDLFDESLLKVSATRNILLVPSELFKVISDTQTPQGVLALVKMKTLQLEDIEVKANGFYLMLENLQDPGNLGTIIRSAYGFGVDAIFLTKGCVDLYSPKTVRSTMGASLHVPVITDKSLEDYMAWAKGHGLTCFTTALDDTAKEVAKADLTKGLMLVIGNEGNGVSGEAIAKADQNVYIPMPGGLESLNASIAASICMYEVMRQRL